MGIEEQLREIMSGVETPPRGNLEAVPEVDTDAMLKQMGAEPKPAETPEEDTDDAVQQGQEAQDTTETEEVTETDAGKAEPVKMTDLADLLEWTPEAVYSVQMPLENGEVITLGQAKDSIKESLDVLAEREQREQELATKAEELATREAQLQQQLQSATPAELVKAEAALQKAVEEFQSIDWVSLETSNPGQAALMRQKLNDKVALATQQRDAIDGNIKQLREDVARQQQAAAEQYLNQQKQELFRLIPDWANEANFVKGREALVQYGIGQGFDEKTLRSIADPQVIAYLHKQMVKDQALETAKPVQKPPKVLKPQAVANRKQGRKSRVDKLVSRAKTSRDTRDKVEAIGALLNNRG